MPITFPSEDNTYFIDPEAGAEMARLSHQARLISQNMGDLLPEGMNLSNVHHILDMACGPGSWALNVAFAYPKIQVVGVDISRQMIAHARATALAQRIEDNATFRIVNLLEPLEFPEHSFNLINGRLLVSFMSTKTWPGLLRECMRVLRPGGVIRLTEADNFGATNSPAYEKLNRMAIGAMQRAGQTFSPGGDTIGITPQLGFLLQQAGCIRIQKKPHVVDYSAGTEAHHGWYQNFVVSFQLLQPFLIKMKVTTQEEVSQVYQQALSEMCMNDFRGMWHYVSVWGRSQKSSASFALIAKHTYRASSHSML